MTTYYVTELTGTAAFILAQIAADTTITSTTGYGGAHELIAPDKTTTPYVVIQCMSANDVMTANGHRIYSDQVWLIKVIAPQTQYASLSAIALELDSLFGDKRQQGDSRMVVSAIVREQEVNYAEVIDAKVWKHVGGQYRFQGWRNV